MPVPARNVLIVTASIGSGHTKAALAIREELQRQNPQAEVRIVDFMESDNLSITHIVKGTYLKMLDVIPDMYDLLYRWSQESQKGSTVRNIMSWTLKRKMLRLVRHHRPDLLVFTHPFPCGAACHLKRNGYLDTPLAAVITDYTIHRLWVYEEVDMYFTAEASLKENLVQNGICPERIYTTGIPIQSIFSRLPHRQPAVQSNAPEVLVMGGGLGLGDMKAVLTCLDQIACDAHFTVVTGCNASLRRELQNNAPALDHRINILGYTCQVPSLMAKADLLVTKPGALTCSEALACGLPVLLVNAIPGQEEDNAAFLQKHGAAMWVKKLDHLVPTVEFLLAHPQATEQMSSRAYRFSHPEAAAKIAGAILYGRSAGTAACSIPL